MAHAFEDLGCLIELCVAEQVRVHACGDVRVGVTQVS